MFKHWWSKNWNTLPEHLCLSTVFVGLVLLNLSGFFLFCFVLFFVFVEGYNDRCLSFCSFYFGHCDCCLSFFELRIVIVVCPSSSYGLWLLSVLRVADCDYLLVSSRFSSDLHRRTKKFISKVHQILDRYKAWIVYLLPRVTSADFDYPVYALWFTYSQWLLIYFAFDFERIWLKLLQKWIVRNKLDIYVFVIKQALLPRTRDTVIKFIHMLYFLYFKFYISVSL